MQVPLPLLGGNSCLCQAPVAQQWLREVPEPHQPGPPKAEGNQKELAQAKLTKEHRRDPCHTLRDPLGGPGPTESGSRQKQTRLPTHPRQASQGRQGTQSPLPPALQVVWRGCRLRRPQPPHLKHHAQEHQVLLIWHLCALTPCQGYPEASDHSSLRTQGGWGSAPVMS